MNVSFILVCGAAGCDLQWKTIAVLSLCNIVANALSTGVGEFLSSKAHREFVLAEKRRALWEFKHFRSNEIDQMVQRFEMRGMGKVDAELVVNKMSQNEDLFVTVMVNDELGFGVPDDDDGYLLKDAFIMSSSYIIIGLVPVAVYIGAGVGGIDSESSFAMVTLISASTLFALGAVKSTFNSSVSWIYAGIETVLPGCACAGVAYAIAKLASSILAKLF